jgi:hypothetical protein
MKKFILFAMLCFILQGCVGVVVPTTRTKVINEPQVCVYRGAAEAVRVNVPPQTTNQGPYYLSCTSEWLRTHWGNPDRISRNATNSDEIWTYKSGAIWEGIVPFVIIPVPLILPVAKEKVCFNLHDGHVVSARVTESFVVGGTYGFIPNPEGGGSFGAWNWAESFN